MILIDVATLNATSLALYLILFVLLAMFWLQNRDIEAALWWTLFPFFRVLNLLISSDVREYATELPIYFGNFFVLLSGIFLLIGCMKFVRMRINYILIYAYVAIFVVIFSIQFVMGVDFTTRALTITLASVMTNIFIIFALLKLTNDFYRFEKNFLLFWLGVKLLIYGFWLFYGLDFPEGVATALSINSLGLLNLTQIFFTIGLVILSLAKRTEQLEIENGRYKEISKSLNRALSASREANDEKSDFLKSMSHELRTPLNAIMGYAETIRFEKFGVLNKKQTEYIDHIKDGGDFLLKLIQDLLDVSNIELGMVDVSIEKQDPVKLLQKARPLMDEILTKNSNPLIISNDFKDQKCPDVYIDPVRFKQILINLVSNASKYSPEKSAINIHMTEGTEGFFRISIADEGLGISSDQAANIFKPFHRGGYENSTIDGVGVGLAISKSMMDAMNGHIGFDSKIGQGSTFWIEFPYVVNEEEGEA